MLMQMFLENDNIQLVKPVINVLIYQRICPTQARNTPAFERKSLEGLSLKKVLTSLPCIIRSILLEKRPTFWLSTSLQTWYTLVFYFVYITQTYLLFGCLTDDLYFSGIRLRYRLALFLKEERRKLKSNFDHK